MCVVCNEQFTNLEHLNSHMMGQPHVAKTRNMRILPEVGHSERYIGPIRPRLKLAVGRDSYQLCRKFGNQRRVCNGCKDAHTEEELKVWMDAHQAESIKRSDKVDHYNSSSSKKYYFSSQSGASSSSSRCEECPRWYSEDSCISDSRNDPQVLMEVYKTIDRFGLNACIFQLPNHIRLRCEGPDTVSIRTDESPQVMYLVTLETTQPEFLNLVILYQHKGMYSLGDIYKCNMVEDTREKLVYQHNVGKTNYLIFQELDPDNVLEVHIICRVQIEGHKVFAIFQLQDGLLLAKEINADVPTEESSTVKKSLIKSVARTRGPFNTQAPVARPTRRTHASTHQQDLTDLARGSNVKKQQVETFEDVCSYPNPFQQLNERDRRTYPTKFDTTYRKSPRTQEQDPFSLGVDNLTNVARCSNVKKQQVEACEDVCSYLDPIQQSNKYDRRTYPTKFDTTYRKSPRTQEQDPFSLGVDNLTNVARCSNVKKH